ncbi:hypothetical protein QYE76_034649 [Lolium multiflorum]|uniref:CCHC-type domain-containing protein n=1 Tax=Lolium multiflorum TaxID=4521 RepID=A0AAD8QZC6_LOLMU|nr:hypothetical protein QYE76_034649 [Lolium multiflorum]
MYSTDNLVGGPNSWNKDGRALFWGVPGRTLENVIRGIRNGAPRLEMPSSPPPSPQWQPRRTTYSSSSHSSSSGPARSTPSSSYRSAPYTVPKREVKEEPATPVNTRRGGSSRRQQGRRGGALLIPKPEVKEEPEEASQAALLAEYERQQRLIASSDDPEDCPGLRAAFLASMNDKDAWRGDDAAIAMSIRDSGKPLVDLTDDGEAGPSGLVKDEPATSPSRSASSRRSSPTTCTTSSSTTTPPAAASGSRLEGFKPYNPDKLTRREAVDSQLNNTALHMIQTSVGTKDLPRVRNYTTAKEAWDGLAASCIGSESTRRNKYNALKNKAEGFMRLPDEDHQDMYSRLLIVADDFRLIGATHINDSWIKEKYIECMMPYVPIDVKTLVGRECYSSLSSQDAVHEMQALKVLEQNSHDSLNRAIGMSKGNNLALVVNPLDEVHPQEQYRASWSMSYPEDLECHYHDHMAFHAKSFWVDPSKAKEDNIKRNHKSGFTSFGPKTRSCYNCDDKRHFIAECPYENRELHNGRLIPKDKSKESKGKYSKAPNKKFYNNKTKKGKRHPKVVLVTREEYSSDEVASSSDDEEGSSKEMAAIVTTNIPSSSLFESPNENPHIKNAHCFMATSSLDTSIVLSTQEEYSSGDDEVDDEEDATSNGLVALASLSTNSSSPSESPNEIIHVEEESCLMAKSSEVSSPSPSMPNISSDLGIDDASLKVKQEMLEFDEFLLNLQDNKQCIAL